MHNKLINEKPHFIHFDICRVKATNEVVIIEDVCENTSQSDDEHQWSYSVWLTDKKSTSKSAWYNSSELELLSNLFEVLEGRTAFGSSSYRTRLDSLRR